MSENLENAKIIAEKMFNLNHQLIDAQEFLTDEEEKVFIEWQKNNPKWMELPKKVIEVRLRKTKNNLYNISDSSTVDNNRD
jgi:hypothetical protein